MAFVIGTLFVMITTISSQNSSSWEIETPPTNSSPFCLPQTLALPSVSMTLMITAYKLKYTLCLFVTGLFHLAYCPHSSSVLQHVPGSPFTAAHPSSHQSHRCGFHPLTLSVTLFWTWMCECVFQFLCIYMESGMVRSWGKSVLIFFYHTVQHVSVVVQVALGDSHESKKAGAQCWACQQLLCAIRAVHGDQCWTLFPCVKMTVCLQPSGRSGYWLNGQVLWS